MTTAFLIVAAYVLDRLVGDPRSLPHPVVIMGWCIARLERVIRLSVKQEKGLRAAGLLFPLLIVGGSYAVVAGLVYGAGLIHPWLAIALEIWLISTTIATKGLADAGLEIGRYLLAGDLAMARRSLSMVVGRDTGHLDEAEISRGAVETVAENIVDAIVSPLFYAAIGGAPLAMAYRAANTLDSMVGYKNEKYVNLGWASARFDDVLNYIPARLTALLLVGASWLQRLDWRRCYRIMRRDAGLHPSPNSGLPEAAVAGALGVQLGGLNYYQGVASHRAKLGDPLRPLCAGDIAATVRLMTVTSIMCTVGLAAFAYVLHG
ncbi:adenosylcobinamide-phosphate synthase CbiB [Brevibacillus borstelensis]|jgi:adenosylcobinamide-phosphate synthase|uniref:adenosylcobinamide-phosphate synthase CbiB n=1 Tax=Brevibacillus TaxID=55080 RepID=UPI000F088130|nr:adenosylcobinamide-phosphate synthase CbiB [Brevibacillus borstelensis]MCC0563641.1 adenosylcobinamide-phosphate synthase CbiB [Brevibacillus borstelensis]MCM3469285.1 adenosylcobinamide-phosphate synthase CbiB [Brevibacillus borstelensis]MCM3558767.1 adenosylcobinamide-phosphate synthase CbiB [Brevibacillus borstelensis]MCM3591993.1 adenosylcobinamide-phosphate synthase CbiB [Brevibacillus borstelensis]MCM3621919.1 adenosylcobinamide-phosphate synthase CbiB [Brevibacillus borstelensis]